MRFPDEELQPKKPPRASVGWFNSKAGAPTDHEKLFLAALVATNGSTAAELDQWASDIWSRHDAYLSKGVAALGLPPNWSSTQKLDIFEPLRLGYTCTEWGSKRLESIRAAMQLWEGTARKDGLDAGRLKSHKQNTNAKKRWRSLDALFGVAKLLKHQGRQLRKLLKVDELVDELPSTWEQLVSERAATAEALQAKADAMQALGLQKEELVRTKDSLRQAKGKAFDDVFYRGTCFKIMFKLLKWIPNLHYV
jgi:hypothetical protein